ncbi:hypothetical protein HK104_010196 [Borealophlyctis nickersoniae]|nr:hypothetical protein HK104_010196 [Borealophlyctis nickersoniae]
MTAEEIPSDKTVLGSRVEVEGHFGTVRFHGPVPKDSSTLWFGVEWDDPKRGKHSGEKDGVQYFTTTVPNAGSFIRPSKKVRFARGFLQALLEKYVGSDMVEDMVRLGGAKVEVEMVGWDKIGKKQAQLANLKEVGLAGLTVGFVGAQAGEVRRTCPSIVDLDLSRNLFGSWADAAEICRELPRLESLRLSYNRFEALSQDQGKALEGAFTSVRAATLFGTLLNWDDVKAVEPYFPVLDELHLGFNQLTSLGSGDSFVSGFACLKVLNLEQNSISAWAQIARLAHLPNLDTLFLNNNNITSIDTPPPNGFRKLRYMNLSSNQINDWTSVHNLNSFPSLTDLRFKFNPILSSVTPKDVHYTLIARLGTLKSVNGSEISAKIRLDAELFYLSRCAESRSTAPTRAEFLHLHPRFPALVSLHGEPSVAPASITSTALKDRLLTLSLSCPSKNKTGLQKRLPPNMTVRTVKATVGRLFGVKGGILLKVKTKNGKVVELDDEMKDLDWYGIEGGDELVVE